MVLYFINNIKLRVVLTIIIFFQKNKTKPRYPEKLCDPIIITGSSLFSWVLFYFNLSLFIGVILFFYFLFIKLPYYLYWSQARFVFMSFIKICGPIIIISSSGFHGFYFTFLKFFLNWLIYILLYHVNCFIYVFVLCFASILMLFIACISIFLCIYYFLNKYDLSI